MSNEYLSLDVAKLLMETGYNWPIKEGILTINWYSELFDESEFLRITKAFEVFQGIFKQIKDPKTN